MKENEFKCQVCNGTFTNTLSEKEVMEEFKENFPDFIGNKKAIVCDGCYQKVMEWKEWKEQKG